MIEHYGSVELHDGPNDGEKLFYSGGLPPTSVSYPCGDGTEHLYVLDPCYEHMSHCGVFSSAMIPIDEKAMVNTLPEGVDYE